jgi:cathepsin H
MILTCFCLFVAHISFIHSFESNDPLPASVDWRTRGVMTPIKSQGHCGSCWTFSTTGTLEAHHCIQEGKDCTHWKGLAEQQLVDCAGAYNNNGCDGGLPSQAFEYIQYNGGIMTEETYDYTAEDGTCKKMVPEDIGATVNGVFNISSLDEDEIVAAVADIGPVSVAYQVSGDFRLYSHGVYDSWNATTNQTVCSNDPSHVNHAVVAVGYGETSDDKAIPFHIIRNSWGNTWGMEGHFWILRGQNLCGISDCASFPLVPSQGRQQYSLRTRTAPEIPAAFS